MLNSIEGKNTTAKMMIPIAEIYECFTMSKYIYECFMIHSLLNSLIYGKTSPTFTGGFVLIAIMNRFPREIW